MQSFALARPRQAVHPGSVDRLESHRPRPVDQRKLRLERRLDAEALVGQLADDRDRAACAGNRPTANHRVARMNECVNAVPGYLGSEA